MGVAYKKIGIRPVVPTSSASTQVVGRWGQVSIGERKKRSQREGEREMVMMESWEGELLGRVGRGVYAVLCLGAILVATTIVHYAFSEPAVDNAARGKSRRRLVALQKTNF